MSISMMLPVLVICLYLFSIICSVCAADSLLPSVAATQWTETMQREHPHVLSIIASTIQADVQQAEKLKANWIPLKHSSGQPLQPSEDDRVSLAVGLQHDSDKQRAIEMLFELISHPSNVHEESESESASSSSFSSVSLSAFHSRVLSAGILPSASASDDLRIMNAFAPKYFPRFYGQHLNKEESDFLMKPRQENVEAVKQWIQSAFHDNSAHVQSGADNAFDSSCRLQSDAGDYFYCQLTVHEYQQLFPFAEVRFYQHIHESQVTILKVFPDNMQNLMKYTMETNTKVSSVLHSQAIQYIGGANIWPMFHPKPRSGPLTIGSIEAEAVHSMDSVGMSHVSIDSTPMTPTPQSADDPNLILASDDKLIQVAFFLSCPNASDQLLVDATSIRSHATVNCLRGSINYTLSSLGVTASYQMNIAATGASNTEQVSTQFPSATAVRFSPSMAYTIFEMKLPYNYISYSLQIAVNYISSLNGQTITKTMLSTRPTTAQQRMTVPIAKSWYRWAQNLTNSGNPASYQPQAIGAFNLSPYPVGDNGYFNPADLAAFLQMMNVTQGIGSGTTAASLASEAQFIGEGTNNPTNPDPETQLDTQWIMGIAPNVPTNVYHFVWYNESGFQNLLQTLLSTSDAALPSVLSVSYGGAESSSLSQNAEFTFSNTALQQLASRGISILISSGDSGAYSNVRGVNPATFNYLTNGFAASWPASSPYVTAVGATQLAGDVITQNADGSLSYCPTEVVQSVARSALITSGGGFSQLYPMPSYQQTLVNAYLQNCPQPPAYMFNPANRAFPDIAVVGRNFEIVNGGAPESVDGTSASSPTLAGFISNINQQRKAVGKTPLGFLNPLLYQIAAQHPEAFNDITVGDNSCGVSDTQFTLKTWCYPAGFQACLGYDAATGLGSPRWDVLAPLMSPGLPAGTFTYGGGYAVVDGCTAANFPINPPPAVTTTPSPQTPPHANAAHTNKLSQWSVMMSMMTVVVAAAFARSL